MVTEGGVDRPSAMLGFNVLHSTSRLGPRIAELVAKGRPAIPTPAFVAGTSRGIIPHITPDLVSKHTRIAIVHVGLEDFVEKSRQDAPVLHAPQDVAVQSSILRGYTCLPDQCLSIFGPRRIPGVKTPQQNTKNSVTICTSVGFANLSLDDYNEAMCTLNPDLGTSLPDLVQAQQISKKRIEKSVDRTHAWLRDTLSYSRYVESGVPMFASIPSYEPEQQSYYFSDLVDEYQHALSGLCIYETTTAADVPESLSRLPLLCLSSPSSPHDVLDAISLGVDMVTIPFVTTASEAGIALSFDFHNSASSSNMPLGVDLWTLDHATDLSALKTSCTCYTCSKHHMAYVHHLLQAKEMLAWTLLQIHNFHILDEFFTQIRTSISTNNFDEQSKAFRLAYEPELPQQTGLGPRIRGYQMDRGRPGDSKKNPKVYGRLEEQARKLRESESGYAAPDPAETTEALENQGVGQKVDIM